MLTIVEALAMYGAPETIRTSDRLVRSQVLYPAELRAHRVAYYLHCGVVWQHISDTFETKMFSTKAVDKSV